MPDDTTERWLPVPGWEGEYEVSDHGRLRRPIRYLTHSSAAGGYRRIALYRRNKGHFFLVHQLVMRAFVGPCPPGHEIDHRDEDKTNNRLPNLEYVTRTVNIRRSWLRRQPGIIRGERKHNAKLTGPHVVAIRARWVQGGVTYHSLGREYGVAPAVIRNVVLRVTWRHIP
jgi:hypothetical protein